MCCQHAQSSCWCTGYTDVLEHATQSCCAAPTRAQGSWRGRRARRRCWRPARHPPGGPNGRRAPPAAVFASRRRRGWITGDTQQGSPAAFGLSAQRQAACMSGKVAWTPCTAIAARRRRQPDDGGTSNPIRAKAARSKGSLVHHRQPEAQSRQSTSCAWLSSSCRRASTSPSSTASSVSTASTPHDCSSAG